MAGVGGTGVAGVPLPAEAGGVAGAEELAAAVGAGADGLVLDGGVALRVGVAGVAIVGDTEVVVAGAFALAATAGVAVGVAAVALAMASVCAAGAAAGPPQESATTSAIVAARAQREIGRVSMCDCDDRTRTRPHRY